VKQWVNRGTQWAVMSLVVAATVGGVAADAAATPAVASSHPTALHSLWNTTSSGYTLADCTASQSLATTGLSAQVCFGELTSSGQRYLSGVLLVSESATTARQQTVTGGTARNVETRGSRSSFSCLSQTIKPGQTLYCLTSGTWLGYPKATDNFTANGIVTVGKTVYPTVTTPATQFSNS
jgi:hypothetical protein